MRDRSKTKPVGTAKGLADRRARTNGPRCEEATVTVSLAAALNGACVPARYWLSVSRPAAEASHSRSRICVPSPSRQGRCKSVWPNREIHSAPRGAVVSSGHQVPRSSSLRVCSLARWKAKFRIAYGRPPVRMSLANCPSISGTLAVRHEGGRPGGVSADWALTLTAHQTNA